MRIPPESRLRVDPPGVAAGPRKHEAKRVLLDRTADSAIIILGMKCDRRHIIVSRLAGKIGRQGDLKSD